MIKFNSVAQMVLSSQVAGDFVETGGYFADGGAGAATYFIEAPGATTPDEQGYAFTLDNLNIAVLQGDNRVYLSQFGVKYDGADEYTALNDAAQYCASISGVLVFDKGATVRSDTKLQITSGEMSIEGNGAYVDSTNLFYDYNDRTSGIAIVFNANTQIISTQTVDSLAGDTVITVDDSTGIVVGDLVNTTSTQILYHNGSQDAKYWDSNKVTDVTGNVLTLAYPLEFDFDATTYVVTLTTVAPIKNIRVSNLNFLGGGVTEVMPLNGRGRIGLGLQRVENVWVEGCTFDGYQGYACYTDTFFNVTFKDNNMVGIGPNIPVVENENSSFYGFVANRGRNVTAKGGFGLRLRHHFDGQEVFSYRQLGAESSATHKGAFGTHEEVSGLLVADNTCYDCESGVIVRAYSARVSGNDLSTTARTVSSAAMQAGDIAGNLSVTNNTLTTSSPSNTSIVIDGNWDALNISDNDLIGGLTGIKLNAPDTIGAGATNGNTFNGVATALNRVTTYTNYRQVGNVSSSEVIPDV